MKIRNLIGSLLGLVLITGSLHAHFIWAAIERSDDGKLLAGSRTKGSPRLTDLPRGITSFGAAVIGDWMYVYGGHFGQAHH